MKSQKRSKFTPKRSDDFFYIEVWDIIERRDNIIESLYDDVELKPLYLSSSSPDFSNTIQCAIFWKTRASAEHRLRSLQDKFERSPSKKGKYKAILKEVTREEYINTIKEGFNFENVYITSIYADNLRRKRSEITYNQKFNIEYPQIIMDIINGDYTYTHKCISNNEYRIVISKKSISLFDINYKLATYNIGELPTKIDDMIKKVVNDKENAMGRWI